MMLANAEITNPLFDRLMRAYGETAYDDDSHKLFGFYPHQHSNLKVIIDLCVGYLQDEARQGNLYLDKKAGKWALRKSRG